MEDDGSTNGGESLPLQTRPNEEQENVDGVGLGSLHDTEPDHKLTAPPALTDAEVVQLQIRVIALENLVIALLANASEAARGQARELADYILPRPGFTQHRSTLHAANQMNHLVERANHLCQVTPKIA